MNVKLLVVRGQPQGQTMFFPPGEFLIGRGEECHIRPNSPWVSRQHCLLRVSEVDVHLQDLGSTNGTLINGLRLIGERVLLNGDMLQIGPLVFAVALEESTVINSKEIRDSLRSQEEGLALDVPASGLKT